MVLLCCWLNTHYAYVLWKLKKKKRKKASSSFVIYWFFNNINYLAHDVYYNAMNLNYSASSKATTKELERIDALYYSYANGSSAMIE